MVFIDNFLRGEKRKKKYLPPKKLNNFMVFSQCGQNSNSCIIYNFTFCLNMKSMVLDLSKCRFLHNRLYPLISILYQNKLLHNFHLSQWPGLSQSHNSFCQHIWKSIEFLLKKSIKRHECKNYRIFISFLQNNIFWNFYSL